MLRSLGLSAMLALFALAVQATPAAAAWKSQDCDPGFYLTGFNANGGVWVDRIGNMCAQWNSIQGTLGPSYPSNLPMLGMSRTGRPMPVDCPAGTAIWGIVFDLPVNGGHRVAENVTLTCRTLDPSNRVIKDAARMPTVGSGRSDNDRDAATDFQHRDFCSEDQIAIGFEANADVSIGEIRLHCAKQPTMAQIAPPPQQPFHRPHHLFPPSSGVH